MLFAKSIAAVGAGLALSMIAFACQGSEGGQPSVQPSPTPSPPATGAPLPAGTPPPAGSGEPQGKVAFASFRDGADGARDIYVVNADGSGLSNVSNSPDTDDYDPDFSPDGRQIVFASDREGSTKLFIMNADGTDVRPLSPDISGGISAKWSPDGERIAFSRSGILMVINVDGSGLTTLFQPEPESTAAPCKAGSFLGDWSPDGQRLAYYAASVSRGIGQICIINADGTGMEVVVSDESGFHAEPAWSPDGNYIAYRSIRNDEHEVYVVDLRTGQEVNLTNDSALDVEPAWSPDGQWIAFASIREGSNFDIFIMRADGSDVRRLTDDIAKDSYPVWVP